MTPSFDQMMPEPLLPARITTVERRNCSATSPKPATATLVPSIRAFAYHDACFLDRTSPNEFQGQRFGNHLRSQLRMNVLQPGDRQACKRDQNIADDDPSFVRRPVRFDLENNCRTLFGALQGLPKNIG